MIDFDVKPDAILTPLLWAYNESLNKWTTQVCIGDIPNLVRLENIANSFKTNELQAIFTETCSEWGDYGNFGFDPQFKYREQFQSQRLDYMLEVLR